jgi:hypothetical protein
MAFARRQRPSLLGLVLLIGLLDALPAAEALAGETSELRQQIIDADMKPWTGRRVPLDDTLRGPGREEVSLQQLVGKPVLAYNYAEW